MSMYAEFMSNYKHNTELELIYKDGVLNQLKQKDGTLVDTTIREFKNNYYNNNIKYKYIKTLPVNRIIEQGIGAGSILNVAKELKLDVPVTFVENNKFLVDYYKNIDIIWDDFIHYLKCTELSKCSINAEYMITDIKNLENEIINFITKSLIRHVNKDNILILKLVDHNEIFDINYIKKIKVDKYIKADKTCFLSIKL